jgi:undecaprenyl-diphosphatase
MASFINRFDHGITNAIQNWPTWVHPIMSSASLIGEPVVVISLALFAALQAWFINNRPLFWAFGATIIASAANATLKLFLHRTRPDTLYVTTMRFKSYSFPSGHAFGSLVTFGLLAYLAAKYLTAPWNWLAPIFLAVLIVLIGVSRVYLGAHFPTDVIAGWILGALTLFIIIKFILP